MGRLILMVAALFALTSLNTEAQTVQDYLGWGQVPSCV